MLRLDVAGSEVRLAFGSLAPVLQRLRHEPPTAVELEAAIEEAEERIMPGLRALPDPRTLVTSEPALRDVARRAGLAEGPDLRLETSAVEALFNRLADLASGSPASTQGIPGDRGFVAALLVLREVLHHGGFAAVRIVFE